MPTERLVCRIPGHPQALFTLEGWEGSMPAKLRYLRSIGYSEVVSLTEPVATIPSWEGSFTVPVET